MQSLRDLVFTGISFLYQNIAPDGAFLPKQDLGIEKFYINMQPNARLKKTLADVKKQICFLGRV
jgi:hypothetical protein